MFALNQGEVCTCPSRALIQSSIYDSFMDDALERVRKAIKQGNPLDTDTMIGAQASNDQLEKILSYLDIGQQEGAKALIGGERAEMDGDFAGRLLTSSPRSSRATTRCGSSRRRSSGRSSRWPSSRTRPRRSRSPTTRSTASAPACGPGTRRTGLPDGPRHPGRPGVDELLPPLPGGRGVRRVQELGHRPGEPPDDARPLPADQEPAGVLLAQARSASSNPCDERIEG